MQNNETVPKEEQNVRKEFAHNEDRMPEENVKRVYF